MASTEALSLYVGYMPSIEGTVNAAVTAKVRLKIPVDSAFSVV